MSEDRVIDAPLPTGAALAPLCDRAISDGAAERWEQFACIPRAANLHYKGALLISTLLLASVLILRGVGRGEFNFNIDEAYNAFTGLFFADLMRDFPARPVQYVYTYFAHYPALALFHWPPLFHVTEGLAFSLFGPSVLTARLTILVFALFGLWSWFQLVCELDNKWTAAVSTLVLATTPQVLLFEKAVMLEVPALALSITSTYLWILYLRKGSSRYLYGFALFAALALVTKQLSIYLALFCLLSLIPHRVRLNRRSTVGALLIIIATAGPYYFLSLLIDRRSITGNLFVGAENVAHPYSYYFTLLPEQLGWALLLISLIGLVTCPWWAKPKTAILMLLWIGASYATNLLISTKDSRYSIYWLPSFVYFATAPFARLAAIPRLRRISITAALAFLSLYVTAAWRFERPYVKGYSAAAGRVAESSGFPIILYDGELEANFMFFLRLRDPARHFIVLRKALYATAVMNRFGSQELLHSSSELEDFIRSYGIEYFVLEEPVSIHFGIQRQLRDLLNTPQFEVSAEFPVATNVPSWSGKKLVIYRNKEASAPTAKELRIRMLSMDHDITIPVPRVSNRTPLR